MNQSSFFKDAGSFIVAFAIGTISLHGILFFLVTDATSFLSTNEESSNSLFPLLLFLSIYAALPLLIFIARRTIYKKRLTKNYEANHKNFKTGQFFEIISYASVVISLTTFIIYIIKYSNGIIKENLFDAALYILLAAILLVGITLYFFYRVEKNRDDKPNLENDRKAVSIKDNVKLEFVIYISLWFLLSTVFVYQLNNHSNSEYLNTDESKNTIRYGIIMDSLLLKNASIVTNISEEKVRIKALTNEQSKIDEIYEMVVLFPTTKEPSTNWDDLFLKLDSIDSKYMNHDSNKNINFTSVKMCLDGFSNITTNERHTLLTWIKRTEHKIEILKNKEKKGITDGLYPILVKAQTYFLALFLTLLFYGILFWYIVNRKNILLWHLANTEEEPEPFKELEFAKLFITIVLVLMVPIIKPLEEKDVQFDSPFWTIGPNAFNKSNAHDIIPDKTVQHSGIKIIFKDTSYIATDNRLIKRIETLEKKILDQDSANHNIQIEELKEIKKEIQRQRGR